MACTQTLSGLAKDCLGNIGGIKAVYLANFEDVASVTVADGKVSGITMITPASGTAPKFKKYAFKPGTGSMSSTLNKDAAAGTSYVSTDLVLQFNRMETTKRVEMTALSQGELMAIVKDSNDVYWLLGRSEPIVATAGDGQTGTARADGNRYTLTLQDNDETFPYEILSTVITDTIVDQL